jgi:hypothetical protein
VVSDRAEPDGSYEVFKNAVPALGMDIPPRSGTKPLNERTFCMFISAALVSPEIIVPVFVGLVFYMAKAGAKQASQACIAWILCIRDIRVAMRELRRDVGYPAPKRKHSGNPDVENNA